MDKAWWDEYIAEVRKTFTGELASLVLTRHKLSAYPVRHYANSGAGAISLAISLGAQRVILLGYDMQYSGGRRHWHGNHPRSLANAGTLKEWFPQFDKLRADNPDIDIINCSRQTALRAFPLRELEEVLA